MLAEYGVEKISGTERVVNPAWRQLNKSRNQLQNKIRYRRARFAELTLHPESEDDTKKYDKWVMKKSEQLEEIQQYEREYENIKTELKKIRKHVTMDELDEKDRFYKLSSGRKRLTDTIYMIAYRSETAMISLLKSATVDSSEARSLLQDLFATEADILPEAENNILRVRVHNASRPAANRSYDKLFEKLNETNTRYPGTDMRIVYELVK